jgi:hypothetical protein
MLRFRFIFPAFFALSCIPILSGCELIAAVGETHSHKADSTTSYSRSPQDAVAVDPLADGCGEACYQIGESQIMFFPGSLGSNLIAIGPFLPIIPIPGSGSDNGDEDFVLFVFVELGTNSLVMLSLGDILVRPDGGEDNIEPELISRCDDNDPGLDDVQVYGESQCFKLLYPATRRELERFYLVPPVVEADRVVYTFPDLEWSPETYRWVF